MATVVSSLASGHALAVVFFFLVVRLNCILIDVLSRTHFRSQVELYGLCSSLTFGSSPRLSGYDRALHPRMVDIFVLDHCHAAVAARTERRSKRKRGVTNIPFTLCPYRSQL